ncbi:MULTISPECIES: ribonucleoside-diphosphate reductase subunit alpha [Thermus]|uniref:Ribonucleoside-diphosphate reductase subunit alpha n=2 Tax=Thermus scotoductus TaxID=37636 RepID=A0A430RS85_THESC|nr:MULTISPECIES: ribonucleoside-diphosphate reductase subunit alpha [Thermus]ADW21831.1 ribonucleoside-diphosphate reductase, subunit alpha [Thermus scotoductus SA-01]RTG91554.1 ribonucleoside-diphosphate reductase subunit alpha [Thermus scotoductus]RTH22263.1 ribonucleoside-diphosphate reductase subunit alpha [Thermus scotoductus]RTH28478.1 ribonucleoside-diphosphate reductase subunit alpha [Thermus scotoductus]RTI34944.1 ribonucleoside-diphosphate reductase subunit alpha [Thermus scotoductus
MTKTKREYRPWYWANEWTRLYMSRGYLLPGVTVEKRVKEIADRAEALTRIEGFSRKFQEYMAKGWYSLATPIWANYGLKRGLPISCYGTYVEDDTASILRAVAEIGMMSKQGGGTSVYLGALRPRGAPIRDNGESNGSYAFASLFDRVIEVFNQGSTRRGQCAAYLPIEHPDLEEWFKIQREGGEIQSLFWGVSVGDAWLEEAIAGDREKRERWAKVLKSRTEVGIPYIFFRDNANRQAPEVFKKLGKTIHASNLCTEIMLPSGPEESFVCCLSSLNLLHFDEWKDTDAVETLTIFLDSVLDDFIEKAEGIPYMERAVRFAKRYRAIGIGVLGWHSYLQSKGIPLENAEALFLNNLIFKTIREKAEEASRWLRKRHPEDELADLMERRNATLLAIAPTKSSSFILGQVSPSIEPYTSNYYLKDLQKARIAFRSPFLEELLQAKGKNEEKVWRSILERNGSVQHLDFLSDEEKDVFKTFSEISQKTLVNLAIARQKYIDQGQSLNLVIHPEAPPKDVNELYLHAWRGGLKALYYQFSASAAQAYSRDLLLSCRACEG